MERDPARQCVSSGFVIRVMPSLGVPHGAAQFDFWHVSLKMNSSSSLAVSGKYALPIEPQIS